MRKNKLLLLLALAKHLITATYREQTRSLEQPLPYATTIGELYEAVTGEPFSDLISSMSGFEMPLTGISSNNTSVVIGEFNGASTPVTVIADGKATISIKFGSYAHGIFVSVTSPLYAYMKDGVKDADKWTVKVGDGEAQALPIGGLKGDGSEKVTLQYNGRLKVKGVTATSDEKPAAPSVTEVTTFSELQAALSAGKDVKLMNDIECTEEISITSGALTIDGNDRLLIATSETRAFKVESSATVAFKNLALTEFVSGGGPAINNDGTIVLDGCMIANCHVNNTNGGGAIENKGKLYAINTRFSNNYSGEIGGAINNYRGSLYMSGCTFTNNYTTNSDAYYGGAIGINGGSEVRLINCAFAANKYGTNTGYNDIGVFNKPENYTIAGCTGATIASDAGDITTNASGNATLDYSDLSNISFTIEQADPLAVPMTIEAITAGSIKVMDPKAGMQYSLDGGKTKNAVTTDDIVLNAGDKVQFYGNGTSITKYDGTIINGNGDGFTCKVYGNIMSLVDETGFATATTLSANYTFSLLFSDFITLTDASGLLLPATTLANACYQEMFFGCTSLTKAPALPATQLAYGCYQQMFRGCARLTAAPELPATELTEACYRQMFQGCASLTTAPALPATQLAYGCYQQMFSNCTALTASPMLPAETLVTSCYKQMFYGCSKLATVTCLATSGIGSNNNYWLQGAGSQAEGTRIVYTVSTADWPTGNNGIPSNWTRVNVDN